jgi:hypothetical protein
MLKQNRSQNLEKNYHLLISSKFRVKKRRVAGLKISLVWSRLFRIPPNSVFSYLAYLLFLRMIKPIT